MKQIIKARTTLVLSNPLIGSLALRLKLQEATWLETAGVDGVHLYYNPTFIASLSQQEVTGLLYHEVMHCMLGHPWRRGKRDPQRWNYAADYVINPMVLDGGYHLPEGGLYDAQYRGMSTDAVYSALGQGEPQSGQGGQQGQPGQQGQQGQPGQQGQQGQDASQSGQQDQDASQSGQQGQDASQSGQQGQYPTTPDGRAIAGDVIDAPKDASEDQETANAKIARDWQIAVAQAAQLQKHAGNLDARHGRAIKEAIEPKEDWRDLLRAFLTQHATSDFSWAQPNKRYISQGYYLPSMRSEQIGSIVIAVDTSGSVSARLLAAFQGEINAILEDVAPETVHVVYCSTRVTHVQEFTADDYPVMLEAKGGGGTRFQPVFDWVEDEPVCLIYFTDMRTHEKLEDPGYPVLWADYANGRGPDQSFGERITIEV